MLECQRKFFSLPHDLHYLNCAYMSPLPRSVEEAGIAERAEADSRGDSAVRTTPLFAPLSKWHV
jgi:hypothetical protein